MQEHLYSVVADPYNFAQVDVKSQFAFIEVSQKTAADHVWLRWFFLESIVYLMLAQRYVAAAHAACVARNGRGLLLCGPSGAGKSTLSYACARAGWTFVTDDCTFLLADSDERMAIGKPRQARFRLDSPELFPELLRYNACVRPTGKVGIEIPLADMPHIQTADTVPIQGVVLLERGPGMPSIVPVTGEEAVARVLSDMPSYGDAVDAMHERTVRRLAEVAAYRLRYERLEDAIRMLAELTRV
jgi:serine kinase of HPr protein (carbohydrate metabolism regulator)